VHADPGPIWLKFGQIVVRWVTYKTVSVNLNSSFHFKDFVAYFSLVVAIISLIIWLAPRAGKMTQIAQSDWLPERVRWSHLAHLGLPAVSHKKNFPENHIINPLLTKFVRSRWLDIGLVLFL